MREVCLVGGILPAFPDAAVILSPLLAECLTFSPGFLDRVVPVTGPEHLPQVIRNLSLVPVAHVTYYVAFEVRGASLKLRAGEDLTDDILQSFQTVSAYQTDLARSTFIQVTQHLTPARGTLRRLVVYAQHLPRLVFLNGKDDIECLSIYAALAVELYMDTVNEHYWII